MDLHTCLPHSFASAGYTTHEFTLMYSASVQYVVGSVLLRVLQRKKTDGMKISLSLCLSHTHDLLQWLTVMI